MTNVNSAQAFRVGQAVRTTDNGLLRLWSDRLMIVIALPIVLPIMLLLAAIIAFTSPGPIMLARSAVNEKGEAYRQYRFRSVYLDARARMFKAEAGRIGRDPRLTAVGEFMMKSGLNTLPMVFNVLRGEIPLSFRSFK